MLMRAQFRADPDAGCPACRMSSSLCALGVVPVGAWLASRMRQQHGCQQAVV